jgi:hypothetical protein
VATSLDKLINAVIRTIRSSGILEENSRSATVSAVNADGTLSVTRGDSVYPRVRRLSGYLAPSVGDAVAIHKTVGGWVCLGLMMGNGAPPIQSGRSLVPVTTANQWNDVAVSFPRPFASTPRVTATPDSALGATTELKAIVNAVTSEGFTLRLWRGSVTDTYVNWIATTY